MSDGEENIYSDDDYNPKLHKKLLDAVSRLGKTQHIKKPTRSEPALAHDEFHLVKSGATEAQEAPKNSSTSVSVTDLVQMLNKTDKHLKIGKELKNTQNNKKVLPKPLEKPVAERIKRTVGYEKTKKKLSKWDAVVAKNRSSEFQVFPLGYDEIHVDLTVASSNDPPKYSIKSDLRVEMEAIEDKLRALKGEKEYIDVNEEEKKLQQKLTRDELIARRKELAFLRIQESQKSAKARLQNKIKSKKFHRFLKREKLKEQLKEFEVLQKTNPEAALEKLEKLEKNRILERANLRHKNTGTWAKNLQVRAKYDKDVRKDLADQLAISRELTQKQENNNTDDDLSDIAVEEIDENDEENEVVENDPFNPWVKVSKKGNKKNEVEEFVSGYRKYWTERNKNEKLTNEYRNLDVGEVNHISSSDEGSESENNISKFRDILKQNSNDLDEESVSDDESKDSKNDSKKVEISPKKQLTKKKKKNGWIVETVSDHIANNLLQKKVNAKKQKQQENWLVQPVHEPNSTLKTKDIDDIFDEAEDNVRIELSEKLKKISKSLEDDNNMNSKKKRLTKKDELKNLKDLAFKNQKQRPDFDEQLNENIDETSKNVPQAPKLNNTSTTTVTSDKNADIIDPNKFANIKPKYLHSSLPDMVNSEDFFDTPDNETDLATAKQMTIAEAFEDDDIVADFEKEKEDNKNINNDIDLAMPGWGSWAGCGISKEQQTKKRLILKFPKEEKRRDDNKGGVYVNEKIKNKLKEHLVSDLPFPFTTVKDYEASIRAPIGRTFVPESAFRILTRPAVVTKMGQIIEPIDESVLVQKPHIRKRKHPVDARIEALMEA